MRIAEVFNSYNPYSATIGRPYIIAEAGVNHEGSLELAKRLIEEACEVGAHAIKFQTYRAHTIASKNSPSYWDTTKEPTKSQFELFRKYDRFWKTEYEELKVHCDTAGIEFLSTPFDTESAVFLNDLMTAFKISSSDITNKPFIEFICHFQKPIILSTGAAYVYEIQEAVNWIDRYGNKLALLHCVLNYPTPDACAHLGMIRDLKRNFPDKLIGYSDHTLPQDMRAVETAVLLGAVILEKHFTHDKNLPGNDHYHAMDKYDLKNFIQRLEKTFELLGSFNKYALPSEKGARDHARRSLVARRHILKGQTLTEDDLAWKRPGHGISPKYINEVIGRPVLRDVEEDETLYWNIIGKE
ncbi:MAG: N-acetylneuraminate synthase family protein [Thermodesulfobacteriota bacterium]